MDEIINKVASANLLNVDLEDYYTKGQRSVIDIKDQLFQGLILKEKDFRQFIDAHDWAQYQNHFVAVYCSSDAIIPVWAYMLISSRLEPFAKHIVFGDREALETQLYYEALKKLDIEQFRDQRIIIKGCGNLPVPRAAFVELTRIVRPVAKSIMYGEACSTVPIYKQTKA
jgi:S-adenosylmethionine/arginine decarboxylase-like enzyme